MIIHAVHYIRNLSFFTGLPPPEKLDCPHCLPGCTVTLHRPEERKASHPPLVHPALWNVNRLECMCNDEAYEDFCQRHPRGEGACKPGPDQWEWRTPSNEQVKLAWSMRPDVVFPGKEDVQGPAYTMSGKTEDYHDVERDAGGDMVV